MKKKYVISPLFTSLLIVAACASSTQKEKSDENTATETTETLKGKQLINESDCRGCHAIDVKVIGPSYIDIAKKYENNDENVKILAQKIIEGGQGNWGEVPMTAHTGMPEEDAKEIVKYILAVKP